MRTFILLLAAVLAQCGRSQNFPANITVNDPSFANLLGKSPQIIELATSSEQMFHEAGAYHAASGALWVTSDSIKSGNGTLRYISRITGLSDPKSVHTEQINHTIPNPTGAVAYIPGTVLGDVILFVAQGTKEKKPPAGIYALNPYHPYNSTLLLGSYGDYPFNAPDDITVTSDGMVWISDPHYGQTNRSTPLLPNQVYSFNPATGESRVVADGFGRPNGLAATSDGKTIFIGDTGAQIGNGSFDTQGPRTVYAFNRCGSFLVNRHVFAMPKTLQGAADGIKVDTNGNVWAGVLNTGVVVWNSDGLLLGSIALEGTVGNLGFGKPGELFVLCGDRIYKITLSPTVKGSGIGENR